MEQDENETSQKLINYNPIIFFANLNHFHHLITLSLTHSTLSFIYHIKLILTNSRKSLRKKEAEYKKFPLIKIKCDSYDVVCEWDIIEKYVNGNLMPSLFSH